MKTWEKVNGLQVLPPVYEKKVGRPPKTRRKQPHEVQGKYGTRLSKHGVIITCGYCKRENHNAKGCVRKKMGLRPEDEVPGTDGMEPPVQDDTNQQDPTSSQELTQDVEQPFYSPLMSHMSSTMLLQMMEQGSQVPFAPQAPGPLPDSAFINSNIPLPRPEPLTTATKHGKAKARKRKGPPTNDGSAAGSKTGKRKKA